MLRAAGVDRDQALFFDAMQRRFPIGLSRDGEPAYANVDFLDGSRGAHVSISGISGVATKTTYATFLLHSLFTSGALGAQASNTPAIIFNVKGEDLIFLDQPNRLLKDEARAQYARVDLKPVPFARVGTGERPLHLGEVYAVNAQQLPDNAQYIGLGHLHRPQEILAPSKTCFAGSLIELDFGEREQDKRVVLIEAKPGRPAHIESVPLSAGRKLRDVTGTRQELEALAGQIGSDFLRVQVRVDAPTPGIADRVREVLPNGLDVQLDYDRQQPTGEATRLGRLDAAELFAEFYEHQKGAEASEELMGLFRSVYEEASQ